MRSPLWGAHKGRPALLKNKEKALWLSLASLSERKGRLPRRFARCPKGNSKAGRNLLRRATTPLGIYCAFSPSSLLAKQGLPRRGPLAYIARCPIGQDKVNNICPQGPPLGIYCQRARAAYPLGPGGQEKEGWCRCPFSLPLWGKRQEQYIAQRGPEGATKHNQFPRRGPKGGGPLCSLPRRGKSKAGRNI